MTAETSTPNAELAYQTLDGIDADPQSHNQSWWFIKTDCGTTGCFAGLACLLSGGQPVDPGGGRCLIDTVITAGGDEDEVFSWARELLGISSEQADSLFFSRNTREDLGRLVAEIFGPRPVERAGGEWQVCPDCGDPVTGACRPGACANTDEMVTFVDHGPVKPPYGTPERAAYDQAHGGDR